MKYLTKVALIIKGDRVGRGKEVDLTKEEAKAFGDDLSVVEVDGQPSAPEEEKPLEEMSHKELKAKAKALELSQAGSVADLIERIKLAAPEEEKDISNNKE